MKLYVTGRNNQTNEYLSSPVIYYSNNGMIRTNNSFPIYGSSITEPIGIYSGRINKESDLGYVWKWGLLKEIINK